jgi:hypothetical protein
MRHVIQRRQTVLDGHGGEPCCGERASIQAAELGIILNDQDSRFRTPARHPRTPDTRHVMRTITRRYYAYWVLP